MPGAGSGLNSDNRRRAPADEAGARALSVVVSLDGLAKTLDEVAQAADALVVRFGGFGTLRLPATPSKPPLKMRVERAFE
jgi:hypothetical protein